MNIITSWINKWIFVIVFLLILLSMQGRIGQLIAVSICLVGTIANAVRELKSKKIIWAVLNGIVAIVFLVFLVYKSSLV